MGSFRQTKDITSPAKSVDSNKSSQLKKEELLPLYQDTNFIGILISDDNNQQQQQHIVPPPPKTATTITNSSANLKRHQSLSHSINSNNNNSHTRHSSLSISSLNSMQHPQQRSLHETNNNKQQIPSPVSPNSSSFCQSPRLSSSYSFSSRHHHSYQQQHQQPMIMPEENYFISRAMSGAFRKIHSRDDLPMSHCKRTREGKRYGPLYMLTIELNTTYQSCNQGFKYSSKNNPRRVLTKPSKPCKNDGYDNEDFDYILYVNDTLGNTEGHKYLILDVLGSGTFGQVVKCRNTKTQEIVAVKVVKNKMAYFKQSMMEVAILEMVEYDYAIFRLESLNQKYDELDQHHLLRLKDTFIHKKHLCLVFELLSVNLYELIKQNHFRGLSTNLVRVFTAQILDALTVLNEARIIHCDLKPENILLKNLESPTIKVIDFGSACHEVQTMYTYIQSRFYRSPEVLIGLPYTSAIDMWSLGCIAAELFLGLPLFPGSSEYNQLSRIIEMLGKPPNYMIEVGKNAHQYFDCEISNGGKSYKFKSIEAYCREQGKQEEPSKRYFSAKTLPDLINKYPMLRKSEMSRKEIEKEKQSRLAFIDFLQGLLNLNPIERWSPQQAKKHPFITGEEFIAPFQPPFIPRKQQQQQQQQPPIPSQSTSSKQQPLFSSSRSNGYSNRNSYHSDNYLSNPTFSTNNTQHKRASSYIPPLPSVIEPPHHFQPPYKYPQQQQQQQQISQPNNRDRSHYQPHLSYNNHHSSALINNNMKESSLLHHNLSLPSETIANNNATATTAGNNNINANVAGRPRANTLGTMQVPPQIQWAAVDQLSETAPAEGSLYSPYYPYGYHQHQQHPNAFYHHGSVDNLNSYYTDSYTIKRPAKSNSNSSSSLLGLPRWANTTIDLERDGDWQEDLPISPTATNNISAAAAAAAASATTTITAHNSSNNNNNSSSSLPNTDNNGSAYIPTKQSHRRSLSSVRYSDIPTSITGGNAYSSLLLPNTSHPTSTTSVARSSVSSLHRLMRGHIIPYSRQDLEWDGVIQQPTTVTNFDTAVVTNNNKSTTAAATTKRMVNE
ncbi:kinase-like domain-containing protein [Mycotypha africana]|uniref:kinase-like domain-containing protein n=1 Tax=Mycotypha africana TaxID=64632 RepID=UPI0023002154|nr:kinase-like domain-containing protein [Mycotypha africana]KAI8971757.1 kinase-like domain-containing protein [Mycotypha africana]